LTEDDAGVEGGSGTDVKAERYQCSSPVVAHAAGSDSGVGTKTIVAAAGGYVTTMSTIYTGLAAQQKWY